MSRILKYKQAGSLPELEPMKKLEANSPQMLTPDASNVKMNTPGVERRKINVTGYGDIEWSPEYERFLVDKIAAEGGGNTDYQRVIDLIKSGGMSGIDASGLGTGSNLGGAEKSTRFTRRLGINGKNARIQDAMQNIAGWSQEYAKSKNAPVQPETLEAKNYSWDLDNRVMKRTGTNNMDYYNSLDHNGRRQFVEGGVNDFFDEIDSGGEWNDATHKGDKDIYNRLRGKRDEFNADLKALFDSGLQDNNLENAETANFINKWNVNPMSLFGKYTASKSDPASTGETTSANSARQAQISDWRKQKGWSDSHVFTGTDDDDYTDDKFWRFNHEGSPYTGIVDEVSSPNMNSAYNNSVFFDGYQIPLADIEAGGDKLAQHMRNMGMDLSMYDPSKLGDVFESEKMRGLRGAYTENYYNLNNNNLSEDLEAARLTDQETFDALKQGARSADHLLTPEEKQQGIKKYYVPSNKPGKSFEIKTVHPKKFAKNTQTGEQKEEISTSDYLKITDPEIKKLYELANFGGTRYKLKTEKKKQGGTINFNKIQKYQLGKSLTPLNNEQMAQQQQGVRDSEQRRSDSLKNPAKVKELFSTEHTLTGADRAELAALGMDVAGLVAGMIPGGSMVSAGSGLASTLTQFGADWARDGLDWGDVGRAGMSIGLDAASIIPFMGNAAKTSKVLKGLSKSSKYLTGIMAAAGATNGIEGLTNIINKGKDADINDYRMLLQGLQAAGIGVKAGARKLGTKPTDAVSIKSKDGTLQFKNKAEADQFVQSKGKYNESVAARDKWVAENPDLAVKGNKDFDALNAAASQSKVDFYKINQARGLTPADTKTLANTELDSSRGLNPLTWKGFKNADGKFQNPVGMRSPEAKIRTSENVEIKDFNNKEKYNWLERASARYTNALQGGNNKFVQARPESTEQASTGPVAALPAHSQRVHNGNLASSGQQIVTPPPISGKQLALPQGMTEGDYYKQVMGLHKNDPKTLGSRMAEVKKLKKEYKERFGKDLPKILSRKEYNKAVSDLYIHEPKTLGTRMKEVRRLKNEFRERFGTDFEYKPSKKIDKHFLGGMFGNKTPKTTQGTGDGVNSTIWQDAGNFIGKNIGANEIGLATTLFGNNMMQKKSKKLSAPTPMDSYNLNKYKNVSTPINQINAINQKRNISGFNNQYSSPELNAAVQLAGNQAYDQMEQDLMTQAGNQQREVDNANVQLSNQQAGINNQIANQNKQQAYAFKQFNNMNDVNKIRSDFESIRNYQLKRQADKEKNALRQQQWTDKLNQLDYTEAAESEKSALMADIINKSGLTKDASISPEQFISNNPTLYKDFTNSWKTKNNELMRSFYNKQLSPQFQKGGSLEMLPEEAKAFAKQVNEKEKAFNRLIIERNKEHSKIMVASMKAAQPLIKKMLG